jgi:hypothetical protein
MGSRVQPLGVAEGEGEAVGVGVAEGVGLGVVLGLAPGEGLGVGVLLGLALGHSRARTVVASETYMGEPPGAAATWRGLEKLAPPMAAPSAYAAVPVPASVPTLQVPPGETVRSLWLLVSATTITPPTPKARPPGELNAALSPAAASV